VATSATGSEPRVPQKRTRFTSPREPGGVERSNRLRRQAFEARAHRRGQIEDEFEAADLEDLAHQWLRRRDTELALLRAQRFRRHHQHAQPDAADVIDTGEIEQQRRTARGFEQRRQRRREAVRIGVVDPPHGCRDDDVAVATTGNVHHAIPKIVIIPLRVRL
jgi:hypothetical protein